MSDNETGGSCPIDWDAVESNTGTGGDSEANAGVSYSDAARCIDATDNLPPTYGVEDATGIPQFVPDSYTTGNASNDIQARWDNYDQACGGH